jgi:hypothetical protein
MCPAGFGSDCDVDDPTRSCAGELEEMDKLFTAEGVEIKKLKAQQTSSLLAPKKGNGEWVAKTPQRRAWCIRNKLVQRYWFGQNVGLLHFNDDALAASVGKTAAEIDLLAINPLAVQVVFDALACSQAGILPRDLCDERRASYQTPEGGFNPDTFRADLLRAKAVIVRSFCIFPGSIILVQAGLFYKLDGWNQYLDYLSHTWDVLGPAYFGIER